VPTEWIIGGPQKWFIKFVYITYFQLKIISPSFKNTCVPIWKTEEKIPTFLSFYRLKVTRSVYIYMYVIDPFMKSVGISLVNIRSFNTAHYGNKCAS
jgi:hypothetical protein